MDKFECPVCKSEMVIKKGKFGSFYGCTGWPECRHTSKSRHPDYQHKTEFKDNQIQSGNHNTRKG